MKRLLFTALLGLTCAQQAHAHDLIPASLLSTLPSRNTLLTCTAAPAIGFAVGTAWTLARAGVAHNLYDAAENLYAAQCDNKFINTLVHGGQAGASEMLADIENIGHTWKVGIIGGTIFGILYGFYQHGIKDGLKIAACAGISGISGYSLSLIAKKVCKPYYDSQLRTTFFNAA